MDAQWLSKNGYMKSFFFIPDKYFFMANSNGRHRIMYGFTSDTNGFLLFV